MKTALLAVSFGTTRPEAIESALQPIESRLAAAFPGCAVRRAFTSETVRSRLEAAHGIHIPGVAEALEKMRADGIEAVAIQPLLLIPGGEFERMTAEVHVAAGSLRIAFGRPLIESEADAAAVLRAFVRANPTVDGAVLLAMAHGSAHKAHSLYQSLARRMAASESPAALCTIHGEPSFAAAVAQLRARPERRVHLAPLMLFPGTHVLSNMCGSDPSSLRCMLEAAGFQVSWTQKTLGELTAIHEMFLQRAQAAYDELTR